VGGHRGLDVRPCQVYGGGRGVSGEEIGSD